MCPCDVCSVGLGMRIRVGTDLITRGLLCCSVLNDRKPRWCGEVLVLAICSTPVARQVGSSLSTTATIPPNKNRQKVNLLKLRSRGLPSNFRGLAAQGQRSLRFTYLGRTRIYFGGPMEEVGEASIQEDGKTVS